VMHACSKQAAATFKLQYINHQTSHDAADYMYCLTECGSGWYD